MQAGQGDKKNAAKQALQNMFGGMKDILADNDKTDASGKREPYFQIRNRPSVQAPDSPWGKGGWFDRGGGGSGGRGGGGGGGEGESEGGWVGKARDVLASWKEENDAILRFLATLIVMLVFHAFHTQSWRLKRLVVGVFKLDKNANKQNRLLKFNKHREAKYGKVRFHLVALQSVVHKGALDLRT